MKTINGYDVKIFTDNIEENALEQIKTLLSIDVFSDKKIRIMPDVHAGAGCVIGFTGDLGDKVIPNIVGVDIGCGMRILNLGRIEDIDYHAFNEHIRANVPSGMIVREDKFGFKPLVHEEMDIYREAKKNDMRICQRWAVINRKLISLLLLKFFPDVNIIEEFESVHNYISDDNIIRKGSISAAEGERCIIPLNMRDGSLLCTGKGNPDWNCSAPHGAGRVLSRTQAYEQIKMEDFEASMAGIYSESVNDFTRDESPMVYKPAAEIIANIGDTVSIDTIIRPIFNFKASK